MKAKNLKKLISGLLCLVMLVGSLPVTVFANDTAQQSESAFVSETHQVFSSKSSTIAPGVTSSTNYAYASADGKQMVYYVATADINRDDVELHSSYKDAQCTNYGMEKLTNQMAAADAKYQQENPYFKAVAGVNGDFYNMTTGQPSGAFVMDGVMSSNKANNRPWFAVFEDGTALCGANNSEWDKAVAAHGKAKEAVGGSQMLVVGGKDVTASASGSYNTDRHSRSMVGVTADNKVVICTLDGRQEPFSCGGTMHELAQIMLEQGCVVAINLDGGGSSTFVTRPEGENDIKVINRPSDGSERSISSGLLIATTAMPSNVFERATLTAENDYVTPDSTVAVSAKGVSPAGTAADIPADVSWQLADSSMGTVENGVFVSNGTTGDAVVQLVYGGKVVGETTIHVVIPETIAFDQTTVTIPYGKTASVSFTATYGLNTVALKESDIALALDNDSAAAINGFDITACDESAGVNGAKVTATLLCAGITAEADLLFGKGSELIEGFEDFKNLSAWTIKTGYPQYGPAGANGQNEKGSLEIVNAENGKVHSGDSALAINVDMTQLYETGYHLLNFKMSPGFKIPANATALGFWMYVPEDTEGLYARWNMDTSGDGKADYTPDFLPIGLSSTYLEAGWHYYSVDLSKYDSVVDAYTMQIYVSDRDNSSYNYYFKNQYSVDSKYTLYMDDLTVDYSSVVDDREAPVFTSVRYADQSMSDAAELKNQTVADNLISFGAVVHEDTAKNNYTGIDDSSAKAYIDGVPAEFTYSGGTFAIQDAKLANGVHTVAFEIADKMGNTSRISRKITIAADAQVPYVNLVPQTPDANKIPIGSIQWYDLKTNAIENIDKVTTVLNLNSVSNWELEGMTVANGFTASYEIDEVTNDATVTITRTGDNNATGEAVIASIPVRTWISTITNDPGYETSTPEAMWKRKIIWPKDIKISADYGMIDFTDGTTGTFSSERYQTITELYGNYAALNANGDYANKSSWHTHTASAMADKAATCTESGYTGRTFCNVCNSVVDWGTTVSATGHNYQLANGKLACTGCGDLFNGIFTDGKTYVDGVLIANGWVGDSYYVDGVMLTGVKEADGYYYDFGDNGVCDGKVKFTGIFEKDGNSYFSKVGVLTSGWQSISADDGNSYFYYFDEADYTMYTGVRTVKGLTYTFDDSGKMTRGAFRTNENGTKYFVAGESWFRRFVTLEEGTYWLNEKGYVAYGNAYTVTTNVKDITWYHFDEETGLLTGLCNGIIDYEGEDYYCDENGKVFYGAIKLDDGIIFSATRGKIVKNAKCYISNSNMLKGCDLDNGLYWCDENGYILANGFANIDGATYYYNDYKLAKGFTQIGDKYYLFNASSGKMYSGATMWVGNNAYGIKEGFYFFGADGAMLKTGINEQNGEYYYAQNNGELLKNATIWVSQTNGLLESGEGYYAFDETGKLIKTGFVTGGGATYYYDNAVRVKGLTKIDNLYYMFNASSGKLYKNQSMWVSANNAYGVEEGFYFFGEDGSCFIPDPVNGVKAIVEENGKLYFTIDGVKKTDGINELDGEYYYAASSGELAAGTTIWVSRTNGLLESGEGYYAFDKDGKLIKTGFVTGGGATYYYDNAVRVKGLTKIDNLYYMFNASSGKLYKNQSMWVSANNAYGVEEGFYFFGEDGSTFIADPVNGVKAIVEENGKLYFTIDGVKKMDGINVLDGEYYYAKSNGELAAGATIWVSGANGLLESGEGYYAFDKDGKLIKTGFVTGGGATYYYDNAVRVKGFTQIDGKYYMLNASSGKMYSDMQLWVGSNAYGIKEGMYYFGTDGVMVQK